MNKAACASALLAVIVLSAAWTAWMVYRQRPTLPVAGLLHRSTVDPTVDSGGHSRGIMQVDLLRQIMTDRARMVPAEPETGHRVASQSHTLLNHPAPAIVLNDAWGKTWNLLEETRGGPIVVVFYLGSTCMACVTHLTELDVATPRFTARGARVLAISGDTPEFSLERMRKYGEFQIPLLSDIGHATSSTYGVWKAGASDGKGDGEAQHGTFIIDRDGLVRWVYVGDRPFTDIDALLTELDELHVAASPKLGSSTPHRP